MTGSLTGTCRGGAGVPLSEVDHRLVAKSTSVDIIRVTSRDDAVPGGTGSLLIPFVLPFRGFGYTTEQWLGGLEAWGLGWQSEMSVACSWL